MSVGVCGGISEECRHLCSETAATLTCGAGLNFGDDHSLFPILRRARSDAPYLSGVLKNLRKRSSPVASYTVNSMIRVVSAPVAMRRTTAVAECLPATRFSMCT
jgi:hypothetical protein